MGDNHIIRVIIQGYDRLSSVMKDAANRSGPALDGMRERLKRVQTESNRTNTSLAATGSAADALGDKLDKQRVRVERFTQSWNKLKTSMREKFGTPTPVESPDEMFARLRREGTPPRTVRQQGGLPMFQSRQDFVAAETERRSIAAKNAELDRQNSILGKLSAKQKELTGAFEGISPFDDLERGWKAFTRVAIEGQDTLLEQQLKNQKALADFDDEVKRVREEKIRENESDRVQVEQTVRIREERVRKGLASIRKELDDFVREENLRLKQKKIEVSAELAPSDEDKRIVSSKSKKISDEERSAARARVAESKKAINDQIALEEAASDQRIALRRHEASETKREALAGIKQGTREEINEEASASRRRLQIFDSEQKQRRIKLRESQQAEIADLPSLIQKRNEAETNAIRNLKIGDRDATQIEKFGARASRGVSDFFRGFTGAREKFKEFEGDARRVQTVAAQIGARFGDAAKDINKLVNIRWALLLSLIGVLGTVVTQLAGALVAVASSAVLAAAALGGALVAGIAQALPVVGLLVAAFSRLGSIMDVVKLREDARNKSAVDAKAQADARRRANEQLVDSQYNLKQSIEGVEGAEKGLKNAHDEVTRSQKEQKDATKDLADARRDASRAIVDASLEERDARLGVQEAEQGVLDAKKKLKDFEDKQRQNAADLSDAQASVREAQDRLAAARAQGDAVEIASASSALAVARGNAQSIKDQVNQTAADQKDLETGVKRAELSEKQAKIRRDRAVQDNKRRQTEGVEGSPEVKAAVDRLTQANRQHKDALDGVIQAQRQLRDANHAVLISHREVRDAELAVADAAVKMSAAQRNAQREFNKLSPAEQRLAKSIEKIKADAKRFLNPITDIIIDAFGRGLNAVDKLLRDPQIRKGLTRLATAIADVADSFSKWVVSPEARRLLLSFIDQAATNLPIIARAAGNFALALANIAVAAAPLFNKLATGIEHLTKRFKEFTDHGQKIKPEDVFHHRETQKALSGLDLFFAKSGKHLSAWERLTGAVGKFFGSLIDAAAPEGLKMVNGMTRFFNRMADAIDRNPKKVGDFFKTVREGLQELLPTLGKFALTLIQIFTSKEMIAFTQFILLSVIPAVLHVVQAIGLLVRIIGFLVNGIDKLLGFPLISTVGKWVIGLTLFFGILNKIFPIAKILTPVLKYLAGAIVTVARAFAVFLIANPWVALILAIIAVIIILDRHFHFLKPTIEKIGAVLKAVFDWAKDHWKLLLAILLGPFGLVIAGVIKFRDKVIGFFKAVIDWVTEHWKTIATIMLAIFLPGAALLLAVYKWRDKIIGAAKDAVNGMVRFFKKLPHLVIEAIKDLPDMIVDLFKDVGKNIGKKMFDFLPKSVRKALNDAIDAIPGAKGAKEVVGAVTGFLNRAKGGEIPGAIGQAVPVIAHAGEWVLNQVQQSNLANRLGTTKDALKARLFGSNVEPKSHYGDGGVVGKIPLNIPSVRKYLAHGNEEGSLLPLFKDRGEKIAILAKNLGPAVRALADYIWPFQRFLPGARPPLSVSGGTVFNASVLPQTLHRDSFPRGRRPVVMTRPYALDFIRGASDSLRGLIHEWAHTWQTQETLDSYKSLGPSGSSPQASLAEGGADAFADIVAPLVYRAAGLRFDKSKTRHGYPQSWIDAALKKGREWVLRGQFGFKALKKSGGGVFGAIKHAAGEAAHQISRPIKYIAGTEAYANRYYAAQELITKNVPKHYYTSGVVGQLAAVLAEANFKPDREDGFIRYSGNGYKHLKVVLKDERDRRATAEVDARHNAVVHPKQFDAGGQIEGGIGKAVPIVAHAGEWVVNKSQQLKLAAKLGASVDTISMMLFGSKGRTPASRGSKPKGPSTTFANGVELIPHEDDYGIKLWWLKLADGQYAQVSATAAKRILGSGGTWFPGYVNRAHGGPFMKKFVGLHEAVGYKAGGVVSFAAPGVRSFASGGVVGGPVTTLPSQGGNTVNQEFNVKTEGETDWHHVMRLGAQHAQGSL